MSRWMDESAIVGIDILVEVDNLITYWIHKYRGGWTNGIFNDRIIKMSGMEKN